MDRIWLKSYPPGVPADINPGEYKSLVELFETSIKKFGDRPAFHSMGKTITFAELDQLSRDFGAWLQSKGLGKGARVAIMMPNCLQYPVAMFGTLRAGCTVVNVNPLYTARELEHQLKDSGAEAIVILENFGSVLQQVRAQDTAQARGGDVAGRDARREGRDREPRGAQGEEDGAALRAAGSDPLQAGAGRRGRARSFPRRRSATTTSPTCSTPAAPPACRKARCSFIAMSSPPCCSIAPGSARRWAASGPSSSRRCRSTTSSRSR